MDGSIKANAVTYFGAVFLANERVVVHSSPSNLYHLPPFHLHREDLLPPL